MDKIGNRLRKLLIASIQKNPVDGILLSGGGIKGHLRISVIPVDFNPTHFSNA